MSVLTPDLIHLTAQELVDCVCTALNAEYECKCPCRSCVIVGPAVHDDCCEGQLHAWLDRLYYHENFPAPTTNAQVCGTMLAGEFIIEYQRCAPVIHDDGAAPSCPELSESARQVYQSLYIAMNALACCLSQAKRHRKYVIGDARPTEPQGGCVGWQIRVTIELHDPLPGTI